MRTVIHNVRVFVRPRGEARTARARNRPNRPGADRTGKRPYLASPDSVAAGISAHLSSCPLAFPAGHVSRPPARPAILRTSAAAGRLALGLAPGQPGLDPLATTPGLLGSHPRVERTKQLGQARIGSLGPRLLQRPYRDAPSWKPRSRPGCSPRPGGRCGPVPRRSARHTYQCGHRPGSRRAARGARLSIRRLRRECNRRRPQAAASSPLAELRDLVAGVLARSSEAARSASARRSSLGARSASGRTTFSGGTVYFDDARLSGSSKVDFSQAADRSHPPEFGRYNPPPGVKLPTADGGKSR
jgi:hypothetical protein